MYLDSKRQGQAGYSMVELLVSIGVLLVITSAVFALMSGSIKFANSTYQVTEAEQSLRSAHELINRDLISAGDGLKNIGTIKVALAFASNYLTRTTIVDSSDTTHHELGIVTSDDSIPANIAVAGSSPPVTFKQNSDRISLLMQDQSFNNGNPLSLLPGKISVSGSTTSLIVGSGNIGLFQVGEIYAIISQNSAAFGVITGVNTTTYTKAMATGDTFGLNEVSATAPLTAVSSIVSGQNTQAVSLIRVQIIQYYVTSTSLLMRRVLGVKGAGFAETPVAEHVTTLQFRYLTNLADANNFVQQPIT